MPDPRSRLAAVHISGSERAAITGLSDGVPLLYVTGRDPGTCKAFVVSANYWDLYRVNPAIQAAFGRSVDMVFLAKHGEILINDATVAAADLDRQRNAPLSDSYPKRQPTSELVQLLREGRIRNASREELEALSDALQAVRRSDPEIPPVAGLGRPRRPWTEILQTYVVLDRFAFPPGLSGANSAYFIVPKGVGAPEGDLGHSAIFDYNRSDCGHAPPCGRGVLLMR